MELQQIKDALSGYKLQLVTNRLLPKREEFCSNYKSAFACQYHAAKTENNKWVRLVEKEFK
jgi:hypothetical protein